MVYFKRTDGALRSWEGMSEEDVLSMLSEQNITGTILTEEEYTTELAALQS